MNLARVRNLVFWVLALAVLAGGAYYIYQHRPAGLPAGFASGNGRLEATEVDVATKIAGRLAELGPREGGWVEAGSVVGRLDADDLRAQLRAAEAQVVQAQKAVDETRAGVRKSKADATLAGKTLKRSEELVGRGFISRNKLDSDQTGMEGAMAGMAQAQSRVAEAEAAVAAAQARVESLRATLNDTSLKAPISGRVLYRLAEAGEVLAAGGKALTLVDLSDMYMTVYLPTDKAGQVALGAEARIVLDAAAGAGDSGYGQLRCAEGPVHPARGGDAQRAREADVPHQVARRSGLAGGTPRPGQGRHAGRGLCPARCRTRRGRRCFRPVGSKLPWSGRRSPA